LHEQIAPAEETLPAVADGGEAAAKPFNRIRRFFTPTNQ
jgi:hypothetical protein